MKSNRALAAAAAILVVASSIAWAHSDEEHGGTAASHHAAPAAGDHHAPASSEHPHMSGDRHEAIERMRKLHRGHLHEHDFEVLERMDPEQMQGVMDIMQEIGLAIPPMDSVHGRELFVDKGCVVCHSVNGVGGDMGPSLNAKDMPKPMSAFEFAARMWRGAGAMIAMQEQLFGEQIQLNGKELADIIAFAHDEAEQGKLSASQVPERFREMMAP